MYAHSTVNINWTFLNDQDLYNLRYMTNKNFIEKHESRFNEEERKHIFLSMTEEKLICRQYNYIMRDFCSQFQPPMSNDVVSTAFSYFKRFYVYNSVMEYHPQEIMVTSVYLALKVEEFNISKTVCNNIREDQQKPAAAILNNNMYQGWINKLFILLMQQLDYHLTMYNCYRYVDCFLIDINTKFPSMMTDTESLRPGINQFIEMSLFTDACLLYSPSQLAFTAILTAARLLGDNIDGYINDILLITAGSENMFKLITTLNMIKATVLDQGHLEEEQIKGIHEKLQNFLQKNPSIKPNKRKFDEELMEEFSDRKHVRLTTTSDDELYCSEDV